MVSPGEVWRTSDVQIDVVWCGVWCCLWCVVCVVGAVCCVVLWCVVVWYFHRTRPLSINDAVYSVHRCSHVNERVRLNEQTTLSPTHAP